MKYIRILALCSAAIAAAAHARTINTPLDGYTGYIGYVHYPVDRLKEINNCLDLDIQIWGAGYYRSANDAFGSVPKQCAGQSEPCVSRTAARETLSALIFGKSDFRLIEAFAGGTGDGVQPNPFVVVSTLSPRYAYREQGAFFGLVLGKRFGCDDRWHSGLRFAIPYRDIDMEDTCSDLVGETIDDVFRQGRQETIKANGNTGTVTAWAARLDFLTALPRIAVQSSPYPPATPSESLVLYNSTTPSGVTISQNVVNVVAPNATQPPISVIASFDGSAPVTVRWADVPTNAAPLAADGANLSNLQRGYFQTANIPYAGLAASQPAQSKLWVVPNVDATNNPVVLTANVSNIYTGILQASQGAPASIVPFLKANGIDFCSGRTKGIGDLDVEAYLNHQWDCGWAELQLGVRFPTGKRILNPLQLVRQPAGNNNHFEIRPGFVFGCERFDFVRFMADLTYSFVLPRTENVAAAFAGSTVKNIGTSVPARVSWSYFTGTAGLTFVNPCNPLMGWTIAYEPYVKQRDKVNYCYTQALDFNGKLQTLDATVIEKDTERVAHKMRTEIFYAADCCNLYGGFSQVVAGKNIARDTDLYLGILVTF